jgi:hypothetical protein
LRPSREAPACLQAQGAEEGGNPNPQPSQIKRKRLNDLYSLLSFIFSFSFLSLFSLNVSANAEIDIYGLPSAKKINN